MERSLMCIFVAHAPKNWTTCNILASSTQITQNLVLCNLCYLCTVCQKVTRTPDLQPHVA